MTGKKSNFKAAMKSFATTISKTSKDVLNFLKMVYKSISKWIGIDGLLNLETCIVLVCMFGMFVDELASGLIVMVIAVTKSCYDKYKSHHYGEIHDFICCMIGILIGIIIVGYHL